MKYTIKYSTPYDIHRYKMHAKDEKQLATFVKMLTDEGAYGIDVNKADFENMMFQEGAKEW